MRIGVVVRAVALVFAVALSGCSTAQVQFASQEPTTASSVGEPSPSASLPSASATAEWREPRAYSFTLESRCGERNLLGRFRVEVEDGEVIGLQRLDEHSRRAAVTEEDVPTLGEMLERAAEASGESGSAVRLITDPVDGHPISIAIDWQTAAIDDEECYDVSDFVPVS